MAQAPGVRNTHWCIHVNFSLAQAGSMKNGVRKLPK